MHVIPMTLRPGPTGFDQDTYLAPADETFTIEITNLAPNRPGLPMSATLLMSPSSDPAVTPVPWKPGMWLASCQRRSSSHPPSRPAALGPVDRPGPMRPFQAAQYSYGVPR